MNRITDLMKTKLRQLCKITVWYKHASAHTHTQSKNNITVFLSIIIIIIMYSKKSVNFTYRAQLSKEFKENPHRLL